MPESTLSSVVFPAPFGPMMACTAPRSSATSTDSSAATPPKRLPTFCARSSKRSLQRRYQPARHEDHGEHQHRAEQHHLVFLEHGEELRQRGEHCRAHHCPEGRSHAAEHHHGYELD